jgi:nicotinate-nucleotide--dimethylbenzimidazole phosphoribosyltransferase
MKELKNSIESIRQVNHEPEPKVQAHLNNLTKPHGSLGRLEEIALRYCLITGTAAPVLGKKRIYTFAGDHGVAGEGVSAYPKAVTTQMVRNMLAGGAAVNVLARHTGAEVRVVDIGVDDSLDNAPGLIRKKIRPGTGNIAQGPAMTTDEALQAIQTGAELAREAFREGVTLIGTGDMGIANTTPSSALFAAILPCEVEKITGRGTGIDDPTLERKIRVIKRALAVNKDRLSNPLEALAAVGGFEIAGICGLILGASACRIPIVVDGFISSAGALAACRMCGHVKEYLFFSHCSDEKGHKTFFRLFEAEPILDLRMRLGEGTGAVLAMSIIEAAIKIYNEMATFDSAGVSSKAL